MQDVTSQIPRDGHRSRFSEHPSACPPFYLNFPPSTITLLSAMIALRRPKGVCLALVVLLSALLQLAAAASSWGFSDATVSITSKGSGVSGGLKEKYYTETLHPSKDILTVADSQNAKLSLNPSPCALQTP